MASKLLLFERIDRASPDARSFLRFTADYLKFEQSADKIYELAKYAGVDVSRALIRDVVRSVKTERRFNIAAGEGFKSRSFKIADLAEARQFQAGRYRYAVNYLSTNMETGIETEQWRYVNSDRLLSSDDVLAEVQDRLSLSSYDPNAEYSDFIITSPTFRADL